VREWEVLPICVVSLVVSGTAGYPQGPPPQIIKAPFEVKVACLLSGNIRGQ